MPENLSSDPITTEVIASTGTTWRAALQVPLLLIAAAGFGFAGQQMWQSRGDVSGLFHASAGHSGGCANAETACASSASEGCAAAGTDASDDCCAAMFAAAEAARAAEAPVSALSPANMVESL
ncbi:MAG TPA: hypothetical protein VFG20_11380 [Planctomycetaceae bacterium]|nr:hypothetical protein [Planctomycetaceae bacterium]